MSQQLAIIVMVDVDSATKEDTLEGNIYLFDNMKLQGSEGEGTGKLITAINGTHWSDGSQANEQVLNWLPYGVGSVPPTLPKSYHVDRSRANDEQSLDALTKLAQRLENADKNDQSSVSSILDEIKNISQNMGMKSQVKDKGKGGKRDSYVAMDVTGKLIKQDSQDEVPEISSLTPIITDITGEAVDKKIIYPAEYGSPDMVTDGWYWSATIDSTRPGTYAYTMHIQLYKLMYSDGGWAWHPVYMKYDAYLRISNDPKSNGFTGAGAGILPLPIL